MTLTYPHSPQFYGGATTPDSAQASSLHYFRSDHIAPITIFYGRIYGTQEFQGLPSNSTIRYVNIPCNVGQVHAPPLPFIQTTPHGTAIVANPPPPPPIV